MLQRDSHCGFGLSVLGLFVLGFEAACAMLVAMIENEAEEAQ